MQQQQSNSPEAIFVILLREMVIARDIEMIIGDIRPEVTVVVARSLDEAEARADAGRIEGIFVQAEPEAYVGSYLARRIAQDGGRTVFVGTDPGAPAPFESCLMLAFPFTRDDVAALVVQDHER